MMKNLFSVVVATLFSVQAGLAVAEDAYVPKVYGKKDYVWNEMTPERTEVLKRGPGDLANGKDAYRGCRGCHKADGAGVIDGTYPRLSGQHTSVLIKQITEIRAGIRLNPKMLPFVQDPAIAMEEIGDIAAYLNSLTSARENGKGPEEIAAKGKKLYTENKCVRCHGDHGQGDADMAFPAVAAQHYNYLIREMRMIREGVRGNSHPKMVKAIKNFSQSDMEAVASYLSRLPDYRTVGAAAK